MEQITQKLQSFLESAKSVNYDIVALYDKEPAVMQIIVGVVLLIVVIVGLMIKSSLKKSAANSALNALESYVENFDQYQNYWAKITKVLKNAKPEFLERLKENKEKFYDGQLATCEAMELPQKLTNCTKMSESYKELSHQTRDEELHAFYGEKSQEILDVEVPQFISEYMESFSFTPEDVVVLEEIVAFANAQTEERKEKILQIVMQKLESVDFGSSLERYTFVQNLNQEKLGDIYTYCKEQQEKLFENGEHVVAAEVLEHLIAHGKKDQVIAYIKSLQVPTHLQELYYRFFDQRGDEEIDFAFIANKLEISQNYAAYVEKRITDNWRDDLKLEEIIARENVAEAIGHDRVRVVIERIDALHHEVEQNEAIKEALEMAKEAHAIAVEAKELAEKNQKEVVSDEAVVETKKEDETPKSEA